MNQDPSLGIVNLAADELLEDILRATQLMIPLFLVISLIISYGRSVLFHREATLNFGPVIKGLLLFLVLLAYSEIVWLIREGIGVFSEAVGPTPELRAAFASFTQPYLAEIQEPEGSTWVGQAWETLGDVKRAVFAWDELLVSLVTGKILTLVRVLMHFIQQLILAFLYVAGPLAFGLAILPGFGSSAEIWLKGFVGVSFWEFTMRVLDKLSYLFSVLHHDLHAHSPTDGPVSLWFEATNLVFIVMYLLVPTLTGYVLRVGSAGGFVGKIGGTAVTATTLGRM